FGAQRQLSTEADIPRELPGDEPDDVLFNTIYGVRTIELNRPKKLNSLNGSMIRKILPRLKEWEKSQLANVIVMKGAGRALCAGGDVAALAQQNQEGTEGQQKSKDYFALEYKLDHLIATYSKPYVAFMDGITMGGGVGLSIHAPFRIATEKTVFAMPETTIGFFPDVGASFFLPRMDGQLGTYLALTSEQLKGVNVFYNGIATHYIDSTSLPDLEARLSELVFKDYDDIQERYRVINSTIEEFVTGLPTERDQATQIPSDTRKAIDRCFSRSSIDEILSELDQLSQTEGGLRDWASKTRTTIMQRSPTSVKVTLEQMRVGEQWNIAQAFQHEHNIASKFMEHHDFTEGVSALLIRKPKEKPVFQPQTLEEVDNGSVREFFAQPPRLQLLNTKPGSDYNVKVVEEGNKTAEEVVMHFVQTKDGKQGVKEKVTEILKRNTEARDNDFITWVQ
ncbi:hypothetical protein B0A49_04409, partial [Cryomyces minteri]